MSVYVPRLAIPEKGNPYYNTKKNGGYSNAIQGKPVEKGLDVLRNCVGYANGRYAEIQGLNKIQHQLVCNAEQFITKAQSYGLTIGTTPKLGSIIVRRQGNTSTGSDGAGHVAIVEVINSDGSIITSESGYNAKKPFWVQTRTNKNGRWGQPKGYTFLGFIYNPAVTDTPSPAPVPVDDESKIILGKYVYGGIDYGYVFNPTYYKNHQPDVSADAYYGKNDKKLFEHFLKCGMKESRQAITSFNVTVYRANNKDLVNAFGSDMVAYYKHYCVYGHNENRKTV